MKKYTIQNDKGDYMTAGTEHRNASGAGVYLADNSNGALSYFYNYIKPFATAYFYNSKDAKNAGYTATQIREDK